MIDFANWLRAKREEKKIRQETLASLAGITTLTISRIENHNNEVTFTTAFKICEALSVPLSVLLNETHPGYDYKLPNGIYIDTKKPSSSTPYSTDYVECIQYKDLGNFHNALIQNFNSSCELLAKWVNNITGLNSYREKKPKSFSITSELLKQYYIKTPVVTFKINYPQNFDKELLFKIYNSSGVMTSFDVGEYLNFKRKLTKQTIFNFSSTEDSISKSSMSKLESGIIERVRLNDIFELDQRLNEKGTLLDMYWNVARFSTQCEMNQSSKKNNFIDYDVKSYSILFIIIGRWMQVFSNYNSTWFEEMRNDLDSLV